jgi:hypothetical protein
VARRWSSSRCVARSAHWVSDYANVPRFVLRPNLLLYFAAPDTQRTLLAVGVNYPRYGFVAVVSTSTIFFARGVAEWGSDPNSGRDFRTCRGVNTELGSVARSAAAYIASVLSNGGGGYAQPHWRVIGEGHQGVLVTLVERKSRYTLACRLDSRHSTKVTAAVIELLRPQCETLTFDNGKEFAEHEFIARCLKLRSTLRIHTARGSAGLRTTMACCASSFQRRPTCSRSAMMRSIVRCIASTIRKCLLNEVFYHLETTAYPLALFYVALALF